MEFGFIPTGITMTIAANDGSPHRAETLRDPGVERAFEARSHLVMDALEQTCASLASFIVTCTLDEDQKANLAEVVRSLAAQRIAIRISAKDPHTEVSDSDKLDLLSKAEHSIETAQAFLQAPE